MISIINALFSLSLFVTGGHVIDTKLGLHHYSDEDYKEIFYLKNKKKLLRNVLNILNWKILKK